MSDTTIGRATVPRAAYIALICGAAIAGITFGVRTSFGLFLDPISTDLGLGREPFSFALGVQTIIWGITQPFAGAIADRFGPVKVFVGSTILFVAGIALMAASTTPAGFLVSTGGMIGVALSGNSFGIILGVIGQIFPPERRTWAMGIAGSGASLGQFVIVPYAQLLLDRFDWTGALWGLGLISLLILPLAFAMRPPRQAEASADAETTAVQLNAREALGEAFRLPSYWLLTLGFFVCGFHVFFVGTHLPAYVVDLGLPREVGAWALAIIGLANVIGSYLAGVLGSRYPKKYLLTTIYTLRAVLFTGFIILPASQTTVLVFAVLMGFLWLSTVPLTTALVGHMFGVRNIGVLYGVVFMSHQIGGFLGAWSAGAVFDAYGSYDPVWWIAIALGLFSALMHWPIRERPVARLAAA